MINTIQQKPYDLFREKTWSAFTRNDDSYEIKNGILPFNVGTCLLLDAKVNNHNLNKRYVYSANLLRKTKLVLERETKVYKEEKDFQESQKNNKQSTLPYQNESENPLKYGKCYSSYDGLCQINNERKFTLDKEPKCNKSFKQKYTHAEEPISQKITNKCTLPCVHNNSVQSSSKNIKQSKNNIKHKNNISSFLKKRKLKGNKDDITLKKTQSNVLPTSVISPYKSLAQTKCLKNDVDKQRKKGMKTKVEFKVFQKKKIFLSDKQSSCLNGVPKVPPCTPENDKFDCVQSLSDIKSQRGLRKKLQKLELKQFKSEQQRQKKAEQLEKERFAKEQIELIHKQRQMIYALNRIMTEHENNQFESFLFQQTGAPV